MLGGEGEQGGEKEGTKERRKTERKKIDSENLERKSERGVTSTSKVNNK